MLNFEQEVELAKKLQIWSVEPSELKTIDLMNEGLPAAFVFEPCRGGRQVIVGNDWKVLTFPSSLSLDIVLNDIKHNNLWKKAVDVKIIINNAINI